MRGRRDACPTLVLRYIDIDPPAFLVKPHNAFDQSEERVVLASADITARAEFGAALPDQDASRRDFLAAESLDATHLRVRVAPVARRALTFLMCHAANSQIKQNPGVYR